METWHNGYSWLQVGADGRRQAGQAVSGPLDRTGLPDRVVAGRLPAAAANEVAVSERLLYDLGLRDEAAVTVALGRPVGVSLGGPPPKGATVAFLFGVSAGDLTGGQQDLLGRVAEVLPKSLDRLDLTAEEKRGLAKLLAAVKPLPPASTTEPWSVAPAERVRPAGRGGPRPAEQRAVGGGRTDPWETRNGEVFLFQAAGDHLSASSRGSRRTGTTGRR